MKRQHKTYSRPKRPFDKARIEEEALIKKEFGLKNKKEIWKADSQISKIREKAKKLISAGSEKQEALFDSLRKMGLKVSSLSETLSLDKKDYLRRRLQTIVSKKIRVTPKTARQMITHKKIYVDKKIVNSPSYIVPTNLEEKIEMKIKTKSPKEENKMEEEIRNG